MGYWRDTYPKAIGNKAFVDGIVAGITAFAIWNNGRQYVGVMKVPLDEVINQVSEDLLVKE